MKKREMGGEHVSVWKDAYAVHSYEADARGYVTLPFLCRYMQESAWRHAEHLGLGYSHLIERHMAWVLLRQWVVVNTYPRWGEVIRLRTWPTERERLLWYRDFELLDDGGRLLGRATTSWCIIDLASRRPQRAGDFPPFSPPEGVAPMFPRRPGKVDASGPDPSGEGGGEGRAIRAGYRDLDVNGHVNNVRYMEWMLDEFDLAFHRAHDLCEIEINYLAESSFGDEILVLREMVDEMVFLHRLVSGGSGADICRARTVWRPAG